MSSKPMTTWTPGLLLTLSMCRPNWLVGYVGLNNWTTRTRAA